MRLFFILCFIVCLGNYLLVAQDLQQTEKNTIHSKHHSSFQANEDNIPVVIQWPLLPATEGNVEAISGLVRADSISFSNSLYCYGYHAYGARWTSCQKGDSKGAWTAEKKINAKRYAQLSVSALHDGSFVGSGIAFTAKVESSVNIRLAVYYSYDSTFSRSVLIVDTVLSPTQRIYTYSIPIPAAQKSKMFFTRFFPYNTAAENAWRLVDMKNIIVEGYTVGLTKQPPTVITGGIKNCSANFVTAMGKVFSDGGANIERRGFCWDTAACPTIKKNRIEADSGLGTFHRILQNLVPGKKYFLRAFAVNAAGVNYSEEVQFETLPAVVPPLVKTFPVTSILAEAAECGGSIAAWGGDSIKAKGLCWNNTGHPTINDSHSIDGSDMNDFQGAVQPLQKNTSYVVRAYAVNTAGAGYGEEQLFTTKDVSPDTTVVVAQDGSGNYKTLKEAFRAVPFYYTGKWNIVLKNGIYIGKDTLTAGKVHVVLIGENRDSTIISDNINSDSFGGKGSGIPGTNGTSTLFIGANDFLAKNITIRNTYTPDTTASNTQAVALMTDGDRQEYMNCTIDGYQDTYYAWGISGTGRIYFRNCSLSGSVDFIFGSEIVVFDSCHIRIKRNVGVITAASTQPATKYGLVFRHCEISADRIGYDGAVIKSFYLGRPWQNSPRTVFLHCYEQPNLAAAGWLDWNVHPALYAEYQCSGAGLQTSKRANISRQLDSLEAKQYSLKQIFSRNAAVSSFMLYDWLPANALLLDEDLQ